MQQVSGYLLAVQVCLKLKNKNRELLCTVGGNENWCSHYGKEYRDSLKTKMLDDKKTTKNYGRQNVINKL